MKCYYSNTDAIGACKSCGRGLSREFATEYPKGLACKGRCEADVQAIIAMIDCSTKVAATSASLVRSNATTVLAAGTFYIICGGLFLYAHQDMPGFTLGLYLGGVFICYGLYTIFRAFRVKRRASKG